MRNQEILCSIVTKFLVCQAGSFLAKRKGQHSENAKSRGWASSQPNVLPWEQNFGYFSIVRILVMKALFFKSFCTLMICNRKSPRLAYAQLLTIRKVNQNLFQVQEIQENDAAERTIILYMVSSIMLAMAWHVIDYYELIICFSPCPCCKTSESRHRNNHSLQMRIIYFNPLYA